MARSAIIPPNEKDPQGTRGIDARATLDFKRRLNQALKLGIEEVKGLEYEKVSVNSALANPKVKASSKIIFNKLAVNDSVYVYELSSVELNRMLETLAESINELFMVDRDGFIVNAQTSRRLWFMDQYVRVSDENGTAKAFRNLSTQSAVYAAQVDSLQTILTSPAYQRRYGFLAAREFNEVQAFSDDVVKQVRRVLSDGILAGNSPRQITSDLRKRIDVKKSDAERLVRSEIGMAHRSARWAETDRASVEYGVRTGIMHMASFLPNVRATHLARSGNIYSTTEQRDWYQRDGNSVNCRCASIEVVLDSNGKPLNDTAQKKLDELKADYKKDYDV